MLATARGLERYEVSVMAGDSLRRAAPAAAQKLYRAARRAVKLLR
jgi:hypothetical protein